MQSEGNNDRSRNYDHLSQDIKQIKEALLGTLEKPGGALQTLTTLVEEMYNPKNPQQGVLFRLRSVENDRERLIGMAAGAGFVGGAVISWAISFFSK